MRAYICFSVLHNRTLLLLFVLLSLSASFASAGSSDLQVSMAVSNLVESLEEGGVTGLCYQVESLPANVACTIHSQYADAIGDEAALELNKQLRAFGSLLLIELQNEASRMPSYSAHELELSIRRLDTLCSFIRRGDAVGNLVIEHTIKGIIVNQVLYRRLNETLTSKQAHRMLTFDEKDMLAPDRWVSIIDAEYGRALVEPFQFSSDQLEECVRDFYEYFGQREESPLRIDGYLPLSYDVETVFNQRNPMVTIIDMSLTYHAFLTLVALDGLVQSGNAMPKTREGIAKLLHTADVQEIAGIKKRFGKAGTSKRLMLSTIKRVESGRSPLCRFKRTIAPAQHGSE